MTRDKIILSGRVLYHMQSFVFCAPVWSICIHTQHSTVMFQPSSWSSGRSWMCTWSHDRLFFKWSNLQASMFQSSGYVVYEKKKLGLDFIDHGTSLGRTGVVSESSVTSISLNLRNPNALALFRTRGLKHKSIPVLVFWAFGALCLYVDNIGIFGPRITPILQNWRSIY